MKVSGTRMAILICSLVLISGVSAEDVDSNAGYSVIPVGNLRLPMAAYQRTAGTITQGQRDGYTVIVPAGTASITADLKWGYVPDRSR